MSDNLATLKDRQKLPSRPATDHQRALLELRRRRGSVHLQSLGARAVDEYLAKLGRDLGIEADIVELLERYERITPDLLRAVGGHRFPPSFAVLRGGRR